MTRNQPQTRVLLADDNLLVRQGLKRLIDEQPDMKVVGETADAPEALQLAGRLSPDVALVDVSMPGGDGVTLARQLSLACPALKVIAVTRHGDGGFVRKMMDAGACGYVLKQNATDNLVDAVRACAGGAVYVDAGVSRPPSFNKIEHAAVASSGHEPLTSAEQEVLRLFASALSLQRMADELGLGRDEVVRLKDEAMRKLGFTNRLQVMSYLRQQ